MFFSGLRILIQNSTKCDGTPESGEWTEVSFFFFFVDYRNRQRRWYHTRITWGWIPSAAAITSRQNCPTRKNDPRLRRDSNSCPAQWHGRLSRSSAGHETKALQASESGLNKSLAWSMITFMQNHYMIITGEMIINCEKYIENEINTFILSLIHGDFVFTSSDTLETKSCNQQTLQKSMQKETD